MRDQRRENLVGLYRTRSRELNEEMSIRELWRTSWNVLFDGDEHMLRTVYGVREGSGNISLNSETIFVGYIQTVVTTYVLLCNR